MPYWPYADTTARLTGNLTDGQNVANCAHLKFLILEFYKRGYSDDIR